MKQAIEAPDIETASAEYAKRFSGEYGKYLLSRQEMRVGECLPMARNLSLLSVGGGHAQLTGLYTRRQFDITVYGSDGASVSRLSPYDVKYHAGNILNLPFEDNTFDVVVAVRLLTHLNDWPRMLEEMCRVSKRQVIIEYPSKRSLNIISPLLFKFKKQMEGDTRIFTLFSDSLLKQHFTRHGYKCACRKGQFFLPIVLHRVFNAHWLLRGIEWFSTVLGLSSVFGSPVIMSALKQKKQQ